MTPLRASTDPLPCPPGRATMVLWLICLIVGCSIFLMRWCPDTPMAKALFRHLAVEPVRWFLGRKRSDLFYFLLLTGFAIGGGEVFAVVGPEAVLMYTADLAVYMDLAVCGRRAVGGSRLGGAWHASRGCSQAPEGRARRTVRGTGREVTTRRKGPAVSSDHDDEDSRPGHLQAA